MLFTPFDSALAVQSSAYTIPHERGLIVHGKDQAAPDVAQFVHGQLRTMVLDAHFPCVAARSAVANGTYRFALYEEMASEATTLGLGHDLRLFLQDQEQMKEGFSTFFACFQNPPVGNEKDFETLLWKQLQHLHDLEASFEIWDPAASTDPDSPDFRMSLAGRAFYVVGLHAASSRWSRRFAWPTLVFNAHFLFRRLSETGQSPKFRTVTRMLDTRLQGSINPNLPGSEELTVAREFSGRRVEPDWRCPFQSRIEKREED